MGRPSSYTAELGEKICEQIATSSKSMKTICQELQIPVATVLNWLTPNNERHIADFEKMYARAKEMQADYLAEEMLDIADDGSNDFMTVTKGDQTYEVENKEWTSRSKLRLDTRKWIASKLKPKKYGDKVDITSGDSPINSGVALDQFQQLLNIARQNAAPSGKGE